MHWILLILMAVGVFRWASKIVDESALFVTALVMVNVGVLYFSRRTGSELLFMTLMVWTGIVFGAAVEETRKRRSAFLFCLGIILLIYLCWIRLVGVFIAAGLIVILWMKVKETKISGKRALFMGSAAGVAACLAVLTLVLYDQSMAANSVEQTYLSFIRQPQMSLAGQILEGLRLRISSVGRLLVPGMFKVYGDKGEVFNPIMILYLLVFMIVIWGWWGIAWRKKDILCWTFPFYTLFYCMLAIDQGTRYMVPMVPVLWLGTWNFFERFKKQRRKWGVWLICLHLITAATYWGNDYIRGKRDSRSWATVKKLAAEVREETENGMLFSVPHEIKWMFVYEIDRIWPEINDLTKIPERIRWIITEKNVLNAAEFQVKEEVNGFRLFERICKERDNPAFSFLSSGRPPISTSLKLKARRKGWGD
jgi:hypothetical protein